MSTPAAAWATTSSSLALASDTTAEDEFKLGKLDIACK